MSGKKQITSLQLYMILMMSIGISNHVLLIPVLLHYGKRDSWFGAVLAIMPMLIWACLIYFIVRRSKQEELMGWIQMRLGKWVMHAMQGLVALICLVHAVVTIRDVTMWTHVTYLPRTPLFFITGVFVIFCFFAAREGIKAIAISSGLLLPAVIALGYFVMGANFQYKDYTMLTPLFTHGYGPTFISVLLTCSASFEIMSILVMQHHVRTRIRLRGLLILTVCIIGLTIGPLTGAIAIFGPFESADLRYPAFEQWRMVTLGKYISHLDFLSIFQWISGSSMRTSILLFISVDVLKIQKKSTRSHVLIWICLGIFALCLYPVSDNQMVKWLQNDYYTYMFAAGIVLTLFLLIVAMLPIRGKETKA
ncbi:GerAB/ArcD/ProY family transporter [Paenibacillus roseipurpureus]|uniref:Endospore germination permease n=1 Tax=Paenibacillus roseopurpureus TaxID=2918901 RepID=A0AA96RK48_9BACL|nr:endospore germination permease [Paenibacillus sp. MBLB1832]WNR43954.1 endospore germination permease [Paenibacillus sp. MBLB1832]